MKGSLSSPRPQPPMDGFGGFSCVTHHHHRREGGGENGVAHTYSAVSGRLKYAAPPFLGAPHTGWYTAGFHGDFLPFFPPSPLFTHKCVGWVNTLFPFRFFVETNSSFFSHPSAKEA